MIRDETDIDFSGFLTSVAPFLVNRDLVPFLKYFFSYVTYLAFV